jgi:hypothetical protein
MTVQVLAGTRLAVIRAFLFQSFHERAKIVGPAISTISLHGSSIILKVAGEPGVFVHIEKNKRSATSPEPAAAWMRLVSAHSNGLHFPQALFRVPSWNSISDRLIWAS